MSNPYYSLVRPAPDGGTLLYLPFSADTQAHAQTVAQSLATLLGCSLQLQGGALVAPFTTYAPAAQGTTVTCPTGISIY